MIDMHIHIVPGLDDGAQSEREAKHMLLQAWKGGTTGMIVTPHCNLEGFFENYYDERLQKKLDAFVRMAKEVVPEMKIGLGQEVFGTEEVPEMIRNGELLTMNGTKHVLIEFGFESSFRFMTDILYRTKEYGFSPIVAHPERYDVIQEHPWLVEEWLDMGLGIQVNKGSVLKRFGRAPYEAAMYLLDRGMVHMAASDAHHDDTRTAYLDEVREVLEEEFGTIYMELLMDENPERVWKGEDLLLPEDVIELEEEPEEEDYEE